MQPSSDKCSPLLTNYKPLSYMDVQKEMEKIQVVSAASMEEWRHEESMYLGESPHRNYPNDDHVVKDTNLFPYHNACYPLINASSEEYRLLDYRFLDDEWNWESELEEEWNHGIERRLKPSNWKRYEEVDSVYAKRYDFEVACFPDDDEARGDILIKLLRYAMYMQSDPLLSTKVIIRMCRWNLLQNADCLRRVLCIIVSELKECENETPFKWHRFKKRLSFLISNGILHFTEEHTLVITGTFQVYFDSANTGAAMLEAAMIEKAINPGYHQSPEDKSRSLLKQKLFLSKNTYYGYDEDSDDDVEGEEGENELSEMRQEHWTDCIVAGLAAHAVLARRRVLELRDLLRQEAPTYDHGALILLLRKSIDSFHNCTRCLVYIGEAAVGRLPNNPHVVGFCSRFVLGMTQLFVESKISAFDQDVFDNGLYLKAGPSLIDPNRYADSVLNATKNYRQRHFPESKPNGSEEDGGAIRWWSYRRG